MDTTLAGDWLIAQVYARHALTLEEQSWLLFIGPTQWLDTEALLHGGEMEQAQALVQRLSKHARDNRRFRAHLGKAHALAEELDLRGEQWQIPAALGELHQMSGDEEGARQAFVQAAEIVHALANKIEDEGRRMGFLAVEPVQRVQTGAASQRRVTMIISHSQLSQMNRGLQPGWMI